MAHGPGQLVTADLDVADRLTLHLFGIDGQRHGHWAKILGLGQSVQRARLACIGQLIAHFAARGRAHVAGSLDQALFAGHVDQFLSHGARQADGDGDFADQIHVFAEDGFQQDVAHHHQRQAHVLHGAGRGWGLYGGVRHLHVHGTDLGFRCNVTGTVGPKHGQIVETVRRERGVSGAVKCAEAQIDGQCAAQAQAHRKFLAP